MNSQHLPGETFQPIEAFDTAFDKTLKPLQNVVIRVPIYNVTGELTAIHAYELLASVKLGQSKRSTVYAAKRLLPEGGANRHVHKHFAVKILQHPAANPKNSVASIQKQLDVIEHEVGYLSRRYLTEKPLFLDNKAIFIISESLPGKELYTDNGVIHPDLAKLNFRERAKVAAQLVTQINELHHSKPSTGAALIHGDLKGSNIKLHIDRDTLDTEVFVIDYGLSLDAPETEEALTPHPYNIQGSYVYYPTETAKAEFGIKTDLYMEVALLTVIFGETAPYRIKTENLTEVPKPEAQKPLFLKPHPFDKVMPFPRLFGDLNVRDLTLNMLNRMQANNYHDRPDCDEATLFFVLLHKLERVHQQTPNDTQTKAAIIAKMWLLTTTEWHGQITTLTAGPHDRKTLSEFDFNKESLATLTIAALCDRDLKRNASNPLSTPTRTVLAHRARAVAILSDKLLLNQDIAVAICGDTLLSAIIVETVLGKKPELNQTNCKIFADKRAAASNNALVQLAAHHSDWDTVVHLLLLMPITSLDKALVYFLNRNAETLISVANRILKNLCVDDQLAWTTQTIHKQNALGTILNTPQSAIGFLFTSRKFADTKITERTERLIRDLKCYQPVPQQNARSDAKLRL